MTDWTEMTPQEITQMILEKIWNFEVGELVECESCHKEISKADAYEAFTDEFVCDPDIDERCLGTRNKENYNPHDGL